MATLIAVVGPSGVGKTALVRALSLTGRFESAYEDHAERPFQALFDREPRFGLANQIDYLLLRAEQEKRLRTSAQIGLIDGGLDLDFHGFTRLFHRRGLLTDAELELCHRLYAFLRSLLPRPELIVHLRADDLTIARRLSRRERINIASAEDTSLFNSFVQEWLDSIPLGQVLELDVTHETPNYDRSVKRILNEVQSSPFFQEPV